MGLQDIVATRLMEQGPQTKLVCASCLSEADASPVVKLGVGRLKGRVKDGVYNLTVADSSEDLN